MLRTILTVAALLFLTATACAAASTAAEAEAGCDRVFQAALKYRAFLKRRGEFREGMRYAMENFGINVADDEELREIICAFVGAEPKTIPEIASIARLTDERHLAFAYQSLVRKLEHEVVTGNDRVQAMAENVRFYEATGFPEFPIELSADELSRVLQGFSNDTLGELFEWFVDYQETFSQGELYVNVEYNRSALAAALGEADSVDNFILRAYMYQNRNNPWTNAYNYGNEYVQENMRYHADRVLQAARQARDKLDEFTDRVESSVPFYNTLKEFGILNVTRGGPDLYSCDFLGDTAAEAIRYALEIFGKNEVKMVLHRASVSYLVDDECALRSLVCSLFSSKSVEEMTRIMNIDSFPPGYQQFGQTLYQEFFNVARLALLRPGQYLATGMQYPAVARAAERIDFPNFPLPQTVSKLQARQFAALLLPAGPNGTEAHVEELAEHLIDVTYSGGDSGPSDQSIETMHNMGRFLEEIEGKTGELLKLASCLYELLLSAEEHGLFMLPTTTAT